MKSLFLATALLTFSAMGQDAATSEFPASATAPSSNQLSARLSGKSFRAQYADGTVVHLRFDAGGALQAQAPGFSDTGEWKTEDGKLCGFLRQTGPFCNDARLSTGAVYLRRLSGEVVRYETEPQAR